MAKNSLFRKDLGFFSKTILICNTIAIVLLLLSYSAAYINPKTFWPIAFFGLGYLPILLVNIGFVGYWLLRKPKYAFVMAVPIFLGWNLLNQHMGFRKQVKSPEKTDSTIRVMTFNAHLFTEIDQLPATDLKGDVIRLIKNTNPDILCFQEFFSKIKGTKKMTSRILDEAGFKDYYFEPAMKTEHEAYGQIIFSKFPIINAGTITKNEYGINRIIFADVVRANDTIRVYNVHLRSFGLQTEDKEFIQNPSNVTNEERATRRVGRKLKYAFEGRSKQAEALRDHMNATRYPIFVMGDFNDTPMSYSVNLVRNGLKNTFREKGSGWGVTHYEMLPLFQIDYILCSTKFRVKHYEVVKEKLSDHYPVWADITF
ncbi:endonuclease/exonuclease/phosphatase family protein [Sphingobacterium griseoflavum]|uniref:Endonuclease n=1 Tax=Sphingobacterium griseoflavum TaxID=1474952 RepID=A0ABQ3I1F5_9SPHI|nr:endonuclease/exonuclease/phosphatase family protein [Sphingobacterium griseoflavum]GHE41035.1 endonuclease [Sphingobacterium griseoflavum]